MITFYEVAQFNADRLIMSLVNKGKVKNVRSFTDVQTAINLFSDWSRYQKAIKVNLTDKVAVGDCYYFKNPALQGLPQGINYVLEPTGAFQPLNTRTFMNNTTEQILNIEQEEGKNKMMRPVEHINETIAASKKMWETFDTNEISDGYHNFGELYAHRIALYIAFAAFCATRCDDIPVWRSKTHSDGTGYAGWFILGVYDKPGEQISYHLPDSYWNQCIFAKELDRAPEFDGHTSADVLKRLEDFDVLAG